MIICSDLDGTLIVNKNINSQIVDKINILRKKRNYFVIVTGRGKGGVEKAIKDYHIDYFDYVIMSNGSMICNNNLVPLYFNVFNKKDIEYIMPYLLEYKDSYRKFVFNYVMGSKSYFEKSEIHYSNIISIALQFYNIEDAMHIYHRLQEEFIDKYNITTNKDCIDIQLNSNSKSTAILWLMNFLKLPLQDLYVIGDGLNDIDMLQKFNESYTFFSCEKIVTDSAKHIVRNYIEFLKEISE